MKVFGDHVSAIESLREAWLRNRAIGARPGHRPDLTQPGPAAAGRDPGAAGRGRGAGAGCAGHGRPGWTCPARWPRPGGLRPKEAADRDDADPLTGREREVAVLLTEALSNRQIAARLVLSERTVESHVRSILAKTQCANRTEFVTRWNSVMTD